MTDNQIEGRDRKSLPGLVISHNSTGASPVVNNFFLCVGKKSKRCTTDCSLRSKRIRLTEDFSRYK